MCKNFKAILGAVAVCASFLWADATTATPLRLGPVQYYGAIHTSGNKLIGAKNNKEVMLRGLSLYWSDKTGIDYYNKNVLSWLVSNLKIDAIRFAMGVHYYNSNGAASEPLDDAYSYYGSPALYLGYVDAMVEAAIENDIYIIIDWHSHRAHLETDLANTFFTTIAQKYANVPNVIFEIYNEPVSGSGGTWSNVKSYANTIGSSIRQYTQNLIVVGTPEWCQQPSQAAADPLSLTNIAYTFHFYAATHSASGYSSSVTSTRTAGYPVFITEWGTTSADGSGSVNTTESTKWTTFMEDNNISNMNWSVREYTGHIDQKTEASALFNGSAALNTAALLNSATYTTSGAFEKSYLLSKARSWADSAVSGNRSGSCAFTNTSVDDTVSALTSLLKSGCTYTSSNPSVVAVNGTTATIVGDGYSILTGNDGSQSVITVVNIPSQTFIFKDVTCHLDGSCVSGKAYDYFSSGTPNGYLISTTGITQEGATVTLTSSNPSTVSVGKYTCSNSTACATAGVGGSYYFYKFITPDTVTVRATAPAVSGYKALDSTVTVIYSKNVSSIHSQFKNRTVALGSVTANALPDTTLVVALPVTYSYSIDSVNFASTSNYVSQSGCSLVAGTTNAIVYIRATVSETETYLPLEKTIRVIVGDSASAIASIPTQNVGLYSSFNVSVTRAGLYLQLSENGMVDISVVDAKGQQMFSYHQRLSAGDHLVPFGKLGQGSYFIRTMQNGSVKTLLWNKH